MPIFSLRFKSRNINILASLIVLFVMGTLDDYIEEYTLLFFYIIVVMWCANNIAGVYSYLYIACIAFVRVFDNTESSDPVVLMWAFTSIYSTNFVIVTIIIQKNKIMKELETTSQTDPLTRLFNRRGFEQRLDSSLSHVRRHNEKLSIAYIDVDDFKKVNDTMGHGRGDELLYGIATTITSCLRADDVAGRLGGDEFGIIFMHTSIPTNSLITRIKHELDARFKDSFDVSFSIGVIHYFSARPCNMHELVNKADELMYRVKKTSKDAIIEEVF